MINVSLGEKEEKKLPTDIFFSWEKRKMVISEVWKSSICSENFSEEFFFLKSLEKCKMLVFTVEQFPTQKFVHLCFLKFCEKLVFCGAVKNIRI